MERKNRKSILQLLIPYLLIAPTFILVFLFTIYPAIQTAIDSTYKFIPEGRAPDVKSSCRRICWIGKLSGIMG